MPQARQELQRDRLQISGLRIARRGDGLEIAAGAGVERIEPPIIEDEELGAGEGSHDAGIASVAPGQGEIGKQLGDALVEHRAVVAAGLLAESWNSPRSRPRGAR